ncbi:hypothetical protein GCM10011507_00850 [Edaphobacter acidisoli]|uniref:Uncharacterized protein n=1 Tax=Edaphobacter acidisoli TaxID=2040573 RepID=A0A916RDQ7_9BACT|nr:hypothetical protein [Edaphobacter acidisoli]GGA53560.1 hypothetical protein GCM10011507_00850 [Edaphobacter acidisoli]
MTIRVSAALAVLSICSVVTAAAAQSPKADKPRAKHANSQAEISAIETQVREMRNDLQSQIDDLKAQLAAKDAEIAALQRASHETEDKTTATMQRVNGDVHQNDSMVKALVASVTDLQASNAVVATSIRQTQKAQEKLERSVENPVALRYKGVTIVPGGFLAGESVWRQRAMNADIYTNFNATPYMGSGEAHISEWVPTARQSRFSTYFSGKVPFGSVNAMLEGDFLSAGTTSNNLQSNSYTLRIRQAWGQAAFGRVKVTAGQMWTLLTENRHSTDPGTEVAPLFFDANLHVGDSYIRQTGFRVQDAVTPRLTLAAALENSQYQFSASNAPSNFFFGSAGAGGGLNNPTANYTDQASPDVLVKAAFDPGYGHYELGGVVRFFRDRYYPGGGAAAANDTRVGGGFVANARFPVASRLSVGLHLVGGDGTGRYGASLLPDVTVRPDGTLAPLRNAQGLLSVEFNATKKLEFFGYGGTEYVQRTVYRNGAGVLVGYAPPTGNNTGCEVEPPPTSGSGYAPGSGTCLGATRDIAQGSVGWVYRAYSGPAGRLQYGLAYSYLTRTGWTGLGGAPTATNNMVYTSFRYYIP